MSVVFALFLFSEMWTTWVHMIASLVGGFTEIRDDLYYELTQHLSRLCTSEFDIVWIIFHKPLINLIVSYNHIISVPSFVELSLSYLVLT